MPRLSFLEQQNRHDASLKRPKYGTYYAIRASLTAEPPEFKCTTRTYAAPSNFVASSGTYLSTADVHNHARPPKRLHEAQPVVARLKLELHRVQRRGSIKPHQRLGREFQPARRALTRCGYPPSLFRLCHSYPPSSKPSHPPATSAAERTDAASAGTIPLLHQPQLISRHHVVRHVENAPRRRLELPNQRLRKSRHPAIPALVKPRRSKPPRARHPFRRAHLLRRRPLRHARPLEIPQVLLPPSDRRPPRRSWIRRPRKLGDLRPRPKNLGESRRQLFAP